MKITDQMISHTARWARPALIAGMLAGLMALPALGGRRGEASHGEAGH